MLITYHGHSEFYLEGAGGFRLLTDPYDDHVGYAMGSYPADAVTVSHGIYAPVGAIIAPRKSVSALDIPPKIGPNSAAGKNVNIPPKLT